MGVCAGITRKGTRCTVSVPTGAEWCYNHDPEREAERRRNASRGGKSKANRDLSDVKARLRKLAEDVLSGEVDKGVGSVISTIWSVYLRAVSTELTVKEQLELTERLEALEESLERNNSGGGRRWRV
jgi:hypothetical protein